MGDAPTAAVPNPPTSSPSEWHSIRPWTPHLTLSVREITSVSTTFILSSCLDTRHHADDDPEADLAADTSNDAANDATLDSRGIIADTLSHGLSVDVNGSNWPRVILRMNDHADEAIIVIYGLHPGRQYDIDLALVSGGTMRKQVTTEDAESTSLDNERGDDHRVVAAPEPLFPSASNTNECYSPVPSASQTPAPEERLRTFSLQLHVLHNEQATLQAALKSCRRDANKTTTSLRADIDVQKRASEKAGIAEGKARQRVRALEDAVRRANENREELEKSTVADEEELVGLREKESEAEETLRTVKREADTVRTEREKQEEEGRKRKESVKGECATLNQRLDRLTSKKERLESSVIQDLEAQLSELEREIEAVERGGLQNVDLWDSHGDPSRTETQRRRQSHPGTIGRLPPSRTSQSPISPPHLSRHQPRSQPTYRAGNDLSTSGLPLPPGLTSGPLHAPSSSISHPGPSGFSHTPALSLSLSTNATLSQSTSSSLSLSTSSVSSSTLSSKAPPFEPTRKLRVSLSSPGTSGAFPSLSMSGQGSYSPSSATFSGAGTSSGFPLSGAYASTRGTLQVSNNADLGSNASRLKRSSISRVSGEDQWYTSNSWFTTAAEDDVVTDLYPQHGVKGN